MCAGRDKLRRQSPCWWGSGGWGPGIRVALSKNSSAFMALYPTSEYDTPEPRGEDLPQLDGE
jgi:hypothetical protein